MKYFIRYMIKYISCIYISLNERFIINVNKIFEDIIENKFPTDFQETEFDNFPNIEIELQYITIRIGQLYLLIIINEFNNNPEEKRNEEIIRHNIIKKLKSFEKDNEWQDYLLLKNEYSISPILYSFVLNNKHIKYLIKNSIDINVEDDNIQTELLIAFKRVHENFVAYLTME